MVLLPNMAMDLAVTFLRQFQGRLSDVHFFGIDKQATVSIGVVEVRNDSPYTDQEVRSQAAEAKKFAKDNCRKCIAGCRATAFSLDKLEVLTKP